MKLFYCRAFVGKPRGKVHITAKAVIMADTMDEARARYMEKYKKWLDEAPAGYMVEIDEYKDGFFSFA